MCLLTPVVTASTTACILSWHIKEFFPCSSLRLVPKCLLTAVVTASTAACYLSWHIRDFTPCSSLRLVPMCFSPAVVTASTAACSPASISRTSLQVPVGLVPNGALHSCSHCQRQHSSLLSELAHQGLQTMLQPQASTHMLLPSCSHYQHPSLLSKWHIREFTRCCSLRLVPKCLLTAVVTASTAACSPGCISGSSLLNPVSCWWPSAS